MDDVRLAVVSWKGVDLRSITDFEVSKQFEICDLKFRLGIKRVEHSVYGCWGIYVMCYSPSSCYPLTFGLKIGVNTNYCASIAGQIKGSVESPQPILIVPDMFSDSHGSQCAHIKLHVPYDFQSGEQIYLDSISKDITTLLQAMFTIQLRTDSNGEVAIPDVDATDFDGVLYYIYSGKRYEVSRPTLLHQYS